MRRARLALLALCFASAAGAQSPPPDVPPGPARIEGVVRRAETGAPVAGAEVALYALTAEGVPGLRRATSDAEGRFVFANVANDPAIGWLVGARFEGVAFPGGRVGFAPGENVATIEVRVDQPTRDPARVHLGEVSLRLVREPAGLRAIQTFTLRNEGGTYFVPTEARAGARAALETALPEGASAFEMPLGVVPEGLVRSGARLRWYGPVLPGAQEISWSFVLAPETKRSEAGAERFAFSLDVPRDTERVAVLVADPDAMLEADRLAGPEDAEVDGRTLRRWSAAAPPAGALPLRVSLPPARLAAPGAVSVSEVRAVVQLDDAALDVTETHVLRIEGDTHVMGSAGAPLLRIPLPENAARLRFASDAPGLALTPHPEGGLAVEGSVAPGESRVELSYQLPTGEPPARLARTLAARTPLFSIFVADTGRLAPRSERLHRRRPIRTNDLTYLHFEAFEVAAGEEVALELGQLPPRSRGSGALALACVLAAAAGAAWWLLDPLRRRRKVAAEAPEAELSAARREREAIYEAIRDLDHDYETGKVAAEDHARLGDELRARAAALLAEERARESARAVAPAAPAASERAAAGCPSCGAPAGPSHRFCAQCGAALVRPRGAA